MGIGCLCRNFHLLCDRTRSYWIIKRIPKIHVLVLWGGSYNFQPCFRGGSVIFVPKGGGGPCVFYQTRFQILRPSHRPTPPPFLPYAFWPVPYRNNFSSAKSCPPIPSSQATAGATATKFLRSCLAGSCFSNTLINILFRYALCSL